MNEPTMTVPSGEEVAPKPAAAGPRSGYLYALTKTSKDNVYIRYLPPGVDSGAKGAYLTVATYPFTGALAALQTVAHGKAIRLPGGGIALVDASYRNPVHLAFPGIGYQVEVYDPSPARARALARFGAIQPVP